MIAKTTNVANCENILQVLEAAKLNFNPVQQKIMTLDGVEMTGYKGIYRDDTKQTLAVMGEDYTPFAPAETFAVADALREKHGLTYNKAYGIDDGKKIVIEMRHPQKINFQRRDNDEGELRLRIYDALDGSKRFTAVAGIWVQVCSNGMFGWRTEQAISIKHTKNARSRLDEAVRIWLKAENAFANIQRDIAYLSQKILTSQQVENMIDTLFGKVDDKTSTRKKNQRSDVNRLYVHGRGNSGKSAWDFVNAVTEYYQHEVLPNNPEARTAANMFGTAASQQDKAFKLALSA